MVEFVVTSDGSKTLYHPAIGEHYHSRHGAVQESKHVFLGMGLRHFVEAKHPAAISILEIGFGTGLNFLLSADYCHQTRITLTYAGVEAFPLPVGTLSQTEYSEYVSPALWSSFLASYPDSLVEPQAILDGCRLEIAPCEALQFASGNRFDVLY